MKLQFAPKFAKSIRKIAMRNTWWHKIYEKITYDFPNFVRNSWKFRKALAQHRWWDYRGSMMFLKTSLEDIADGIETKGIEQDVDRLKKVQKIRRVLQIMQNIESYEYVKMAENAVGPLPENAGAFKKIEGTDLYEFDFQDTPEQREQRSKVYQKANEIEEDEWKELWQNIMGKDHAEYLKLLKDPKTTAKRKANLWNEWFDGSGMRGWWD